MIELPVAMFQNHLWMYSFTVLVLGCFRTDTRQNYQSADWTAAKSAWWSAWRSNMIKWYHGTVPSGILNSAPLIIIPYPYHSTCGIDLNTIAPALFFGSKCFGLFFLLGPNKFNQVQCAACIRTVLTAWGLGRYQYSDKAICHDPFWSCRNLMSWQCHAMSICAVMCHKPLQSVSCWNHPL